MAKKTGGKNNGATKGVIPTVKDGIGSAKQGVKNLLYGREPEVSPGKLADDNRATGEEIIASLRSVDFSKLKKEEGMTEERLTDMRNSVKALILKIEQAPTIFDDISKLDDILLKAADTLKTAAEYGYVDQAEWCINAISTGLLLLRDNVPPQRQDAREDIIKKRVHYMENYDNIISIYGTINGTTKAIEQTDATIKQYEEDYIPKKQQIEALSDEYIARINANENQPGKLNEQEQAVVLLARQAGDLASAIIRLRNMRYAKIMENESDIAKAMGFRTALDNLPLLYDEDLLGEYATVLKEINTTTNKMLVDAAEALRIEEEAAREMEFIMNGDAAQKLVAYSRKVIEKIIMPENRISQREMLEVQVLKSKKMRNQQLALENKQKLKQMMTMAQANENENVNGDINFNVNEDAVTVTDSYVSTDTNDLDDSNYNLNS